MSEARVVLVTVPDDAVATRIAGSLVDEGLAACVNVVSGVRSLYRWKGRVEEDAELLLVIKSVAERCEALAARVEALHPYELPEVLVLPVAGGSPRYLDWIADSSQTEPPK